MTTVDLVCKVPLDVLHILKIDRDHLTIIPKQQMGDCSTYEMPRSVRRKLAGSMNETNLPVADLPTTAANLLSANMLAMIFGFLPVKEIMRSRRVCSDWKEAAKGTFVPFKNYCSYDEFNVWNTDTLRAMQAMTTALPNLQQLSISHIIDSDAYKQQRLIMHRYIVGDNPDYPINRRSRNLPPHDINIISNFKHLRKLEISNTAPLEGEYPVFFNFPLLQELTINSLLCDDPPSYGHSYLKWDLTMLEGLPMLRYLECSELGGVTGNVNSLSILKGTIEAIRITECHDIVGNFMDLADFPRLEWLDLTSTRVTGDIRDIGENDFKALNTLSLPRTVYGGSRYAFQTIAEVPDFINRIYPLAKRMYVDTYWRLSNESPDFYDDPNEVDYEDNRKDHQIPPPFVCELINVGDIRMGWRWRCSFPNDRREDRVSPYEEDYNMDIDYVEEVELASSCEINWLEPEPDRGSDDYEKYTHPLHRLKDTPTFYRGYHNPPTEEEYNRLRHEHFGEHFVDEDFAH